MVTEAVTVEDRAVIVTLPGPSVVTFPHTPYSSTVAMAAFEVVQ